MIVAQLENFIPLLLKWEGGYVNDPADAGGPTKMGVTLKTWQAQGYDKNGDGVIDEDDLKLLSWEDVIERILRPHYWNRWRADEIRSQALANILVGWVWGSGRYGITIPQGILGVKQDGIVGAKTVSAVNNYPDPEALFEKIKQMRRAFFYLICEKRPANKRFLKGWLNRLNDYQWIPMMFCLCFLFSCRSAQQTVKAEKNLSAAVHEQWISTRDKEAVSLQQEFGRWTGDEESRIETVSFVFDTLGIQRLSLSRMVRKRSDFAEKQGEEQSRQVETTVNGKKTDLVLQAKEQIEQKTSRVPRRKWLMGGIIGCAIVGMCLYFYFTKNTMGGRLRS